MTKLMTVASQDIEKLAAGPRTRRKPKRLPDRSRTGLFETDRSDEELFEVVAQILTAKGVAPGEHLAQTPFDAARALKPEFASCPTARQIAARLQRPWKSIVQIAHKQAGGPGFMRAAVATQRAPENNVFDERNLVLALTVISKRLDRRTFGEQTYDAEREELLKDAVRENTIGFWRQALPSSSQVKRIAGGSWDVALAMAQLAPRRDITLIGGGTMAAGRVKRRLESSQRKSKDAKARTGKKAVGERAQRNRKRTGKAKNQWSAAGPDAPAQEIRGGQLSQNPALSVVDTLVEFAVSQQAWPTSVSSINAWATHFNIGVSCGTYKGDECEALLAAAAEKLRTEGLAAPALDLRVTKSQVNLDATVREGLPLRRRREYTLRECTDLVKDCMLEKGKRLDLRQPVYLAWATGVPGRPSPGVFQQHGGLTRIRGLAAAELRAEGR